jgi:hypothetical protein
MDKVNILMKEMLTNKRMIALELSRKRLDRLNMILRQHFVRKVFRNKYFWYAVTNMNNIIQIPIDDPNNYKIIDNLLYKDLKIANVIRSKATKDYNRIILTVNGRMDDIDALGIPYSLDEYEARMDITDRKEVRDEVNEILLKRYEELYQHIVDRYPGVFELVKKLDARIYDFNIYLYGTIKCSFVDKELWLTKEDKVTEVDLSKTNIKEVEKIIKKVIIS